MCQKYQVGRRKARELELFSLDASEERAMQASSDTLQLYALSFTTRRRAR